MDKVSIVTVTFNCQSIVQKTIESVLSQDYPNIEYIIVDGSSSDNTLEVIKKYEDQIDCIVSEPDNGVYDAMNKSVKLATGDWILFMNAGDCFYSKNTVTKMFSDFHEQIGVVFGDTISEKDGCEIITRYQPNWWRHKYMPSCHQSIFVRRELLLRNPFQLRFRIVADVYSFKCFREQNVQFKYIPEIVARYDISEGISQNPEKYMKELFLVLYKKPLSDIYYLLFVIKYTILKFVRKIIDIK